jgi:hypothetical protein
MYPPHHQLFLAVEVQVLGLIVQWNAGHVWYQHLLLSGIEV